MSADLNTAVLLTLSYSDQFSFPLTSQEVLLRLVLNGGLDGWSGKFGGESYHQTLVKITQTLERLKRWGVVDRSGQYYHLVGRERVVELREQRLIWSEQKQAEIDRVLRLMRWIPWLKAVVVTGSVAVDNALLESDIDFFMVTDRRRMWLTRLLVLVITWWQGKQRTWNHPVDRSWCFNMWVDEDHLELPLVKRSVYTAYEVCQARWVWDASSIRPIFYQQNSWVQQWLPFFWQHRVNEVSKPKQTHQRSSFWQKYLIGVVLNVVDAVAHLLQYAYMYSHMSREWVGRGYAYFHPRDTRQMINDNWLRSLLMAQTRIPDQVLEVVDQAHLAMKKIVLVTGVFDLFHIEHRRFLRKAKAVGDVLIVGVESDPRVKKLKGMTRPTYPAPLRVEQITQTGLADAVFILPEKFDERIDHLRLLQIIRPHILAVSEHTPHLVGKQALMRQIGGEMMIVHSQNPALSTTLLLKHQWDGGVT